MSISCVTKVMGLAIDRDGNFYISDYVPQSGSTVYVLDVSTGVATPMLNSGLAFVHAIAFKFRAGEWLRAGANAPSSPERACGSIRPSRPLRSRGPEELS